MLKKSTVLMILVAVLLGFGLAKVMSQSGKSGEAIPNGSVTIEEAQRALIRPCLNVLNTTVESEFRDGCKVMFGQMTRDEQFQFNLALSSPNFPVCDGDVKKSIETGNFKFLYKEFQPYGCGTKTVKLFKVFVGSEKGGISYYWSDDSIYIQ